MQTSTRTIIITGIGILFFTGIAIFGYHRLGDYFTGPEIIDFSLPKYSETDQSALGISGTFKNVSSITLNGRSIIPNQDNSWSDTVVLLPGLNIIELGIEDTFAQRKEYQYYIYSTAQYENYPPTYRTAVQQKEEQENQITTINE